MDLFLDLATRIGLRDELLIALVDQCGERRDMAEDKKAKPDFLDVDKDGNKKETFKKAVKDKAKK